jgi:hypothetical protein
MVFPVVLAYVDKIEDHRQSREYFMGMGMGSIKRWMHMPPDFSFMGK